MITKVLSLFALLFATFSSHAVVLLNSGQSYNTSFILQSDGAAFKESDNYWDMLFKFTDSNNPAFTLGGNTITVTLFENINFTAPVFSQSVDSSTGAGAVGAFFGNNSPLFTDLSGSLRVTYVDTNTGTGVATLQEITIANFAGLNGDSFVATTTFEPMTSPVPWPATAMLLLPGLLFTTLAASRKRAGKARR